MIEVGGGMWITSAIEWVKGIQPSTWYNTSMTAIAAISALYSAKSFHLNRKQLKRKPLSFEPTFKRSMEGSQWSETILLVRNLEPYEARISSIKVRGRNAQFIMNDRVYKLQRDNSPTAFRTMNTRVAAASAKPSKTHIYLYTRGMKSRRNFKVDWHWLDGTER